MFCPEKLEKLNESDIFQVSGGFECVLVQMFLIQTVSACYFISEGRLSYPLSGDMIILCVG